jgi:hypothetical protein
MANDSINCDQYNTPEKLFIQGQVDLIRIAKQSVNEMGGSDFTVRSREIEACEQPPNEKSRILPMDNPQPRAMRTART